MQSRRLPLLLLLVLIAISSPLRAEPRDESASGSATISIIVPAMAGVSVPERVGARVDAHATVARTATFTSAPAGSVTFVRPETPPRFVLASAAAPRARVVARSGWLLHEHRLPAMPVAASGNSTPRVIVEVWQF